MRKLGIAALALSLSPSLAFADAAPAVYPGCDAPSLTFAHTWTFDPVDGDDVRGDGSAARPWKTVQSLVAPGAWGGPRLSSVPYHHNPGTGWTWDPNPAATIHPGDAVALMTGNHGKLSVGVYGKMVENGEGWITLTAAPGATPVLKALKLAGTDHWRFTGLKFQDSVVSIHGGPPMIAVNGTIGATTHDIVFDHITASSNDVLNFAADPTAFNTSVVSGARFDDSSGINCVALTESHFFNLMFGVSSTTAQTLIDRNEFDHLGADGVDLNAGQAIVTNNYIHDMQSTDPVMWHVDFIQGQGYAHGVQPGVFNSVVIDSNRLIRQVDPALSPIVAGAQGIDAFDGEWSDVRITRNVIITSACWGLSWGGTRGMLMANNTVVFDGFAPGVANANGVPMCTPIFNPIGPTHQAPTGDHVVAVNNIVPAGGMPELPVGSVVTSNLVTYKPWTIVTATGAKVFQAKGVFSGNIVLGVDPPVGLFTKWDRAGNVFDLRPAPGSPAIGRGVPAIPAPGDLTAYPDLTLPETDIAGVRYDPVHPSIGAYAFVPTR